MSCCSLDTARHDELSGGDPIYMIKRFLRYFSSSAADGRKQSLILLALEAAIFLWFILSGAGRTEPLLFLIPAFAAFLTGILLYRNQSRISAQAAQLAEFNRALNDASRRDALTGLLNRMALETDAHRMDGRPMTAYMIDINYFKEINDRYGHAAGDALLREASHALQHLFPGAHYYRYGGDEFLVLTYKPATENFGADTYDLRNSPNGVRMLMSIGSAQGAPTGYEELFTLISQADKELYVVKKRTHSAEYGGHDRRRDEQYRGKKTAGVCA